MYQQTDEKLNMYLEGMYVCNNYLPRLYSS